MGSCQSDCCKSIPPDPWLVGIWISEDATNRTNLLANHNYEKKTSMYGCSKLKRTSIYKPCTGAVLEVSPTGYINYIEMEDVTARLMYSGPINDWNGQDNTWLGCCAGKCCCCPKGCVHFDVEIPSTSRAYPTNIRVNGRIMTKSACIPVALATPIENRYQSPTPQNSYNASKYLHHKAS
ncbi:hypothetical protein QTG54_006473 [Skeletonema marinoi]|uniref:Uncharacterized protein n=1 Tax=Skeletonema marinoi TaxID=267567 RepID=A0AAD8YCP4_9STRA|nr:hypothetical protein QTG54_006473 [Skeletonema marinoi]